MRTLLVVSLCCILSSCATPYTRTITVTGEATRTLVPTAANVSVVMSCLRPTPAAARRALDSVLHGVQRAVRDHGMAPGDLASTRYSVTETMVNRRTNPPTYNYDSAVGWTARSTATIRAKDLTVLDSLLATLVELREVSIQDMSFYVDSLERIYDTLRQEASVSARARAEQMASPLSCEPAQPITINDGTRIDAYNSNDGGFVIRGSRAYESAGIVSSMVVSNEFVAGSSVSPGLVKITRAVNVKFELVPK